MNAFSGARQTSRRSMHISNVVYTCTVTHAKRTFTAIVITVLTHLFTVLLSVNRRCLSVCLCVCVTKKLEIIQNGQTTDRAATYADILN